MKEIPCLFFVSVLVFCIEIPGLVALRNVNISLPSHVRRGANVQLSCTYDLENEPLYAVKWYKGTLEFYRYLPKEAPPYKAFPVSGFSVDVTLSNETSVSLRNVTLDGAGLFKCLVAAEFPFQTVYSAAEMGVVVIRDDAPLVKLDRSQSQYHPGDPVFAQCTSPASYPPAKITWYKNDIEFQPDDLVKTKTDARKDKDDPVEKLTVSSISFNLSEKVTPVGIKCRATVYPLYDQNSSSTIIDPIPRRLTGTETLLRSGSSGASYHLDVFLVQLGVGSWILSWSIYNHNL